MEDCRVARMVKNVIGKAVNARQLNARQLASWPATSADSGTSDRQYKSVAFFYAFDNLATLSSAKIGNHKNRQTTLV